MCKSLSKIVPHMAATVHCIFSVCTAFVSFSCFLFLKHDQFYQGWTDEHSAEHTTKYLQNIYQNNIFIIQTWCWTL